jgi:RimJ/RimL family protein N-acetyltransferase
MANMVEKLWTEFIKNAICRYAIVLKETNEFIGWANIKFNVELENDHLILIGYRLIRVLGKGYGYEVAKAWLYFGFIKMNIQLFMHPHISKIVAPEEFWKIRITIGF